MANFSNWDIFDTLQNQILIRIKNLIGEKDAKQKAPFLEGPLNNCLNYGFIFHPFTGYFNLIMQIT